MYPTSTNQRKYHISSQRWTTIVLDFSRNMKDTDLKPNRITRCISVVDKFCKEYCQSNTLSQIQLISTSNGLAHTISNYTGSSDSLFEAIRSSLVDSSQTTDDSKDSVVGKGTISIQNTFKLINETSKYLPNYGKREVIMLIGSLSTQDPGDVWNEIEIMAENQFVVYVIHMSAEVYILKRISDFTKGEYHVALDEQSLEDLMMQYRDPPLLTIEELQTLEEQKGMIEVGFPSFVKSITNDKTMLECPNCHFIISNTSLPTTCTICASLLLDNISLARNYVNGSTLPYFRLTSVVTDKHCIGCQTNLRVQNQDNFTCTSCGNLLCAVCKSFVQNTLHACPGCT